VLDDGNADVLGEFELLLVAPVDRLGRPLLVAIPDAEAVPQVDEVTEPLTVADAKPDVVTLTENDTVALSLEHRLALVSALADAGAEPVMVPDTVPDPIVEGELVADDETLPVREAHALVVGIDEDTAIVLEPRKRLRVIGAGGVCIIDAHEATDSNVSSLDPDKTLSISNVKLHLLAQGDHFDLPGRCPHAARPQRPLKKAPV
jgi:hypothetical protein